MKVSLNYKVIADRFSSKANSDSRSNGKGFAKSSYVHGNLALKGDEVSEPSSFEALLINEFKASSLNRNAKLLSSNSAISKRAVTPTEQKAIHFLDGYWA